MWIAALWRWLLSWDPRLWFWAHDPWEDDPVDAPPGTPEPPTGIGS